MTSYCVSITKQITAKSYLFVNCMVRYMSLYSLYVKQNKTNLTENFNSAISGKLANYDASIKFLEEKC
jgi:hypothetical protein